MTLSKAMLVRETGAPDVIESGEIALAEPVGNQILIRMLAAGFNPVDTKIRAGLAPVMCESSTLGCEMCGEIVACGGQVTDWQPGDLVFGLTGGVRGHMGAGAEHVLVDASLVAAKPESCTVDVAGSVSVIGLTALEVMARLNPVAGRSLLILGASGGVGRCLTQLAVAAGLEVTGTAGTDARLQDLQAHGCRAVSHCEVAGLIEQGTTFDYIADMHGGEALIQALQLARPYGAVCTINARGTHDFSAAHAKGLRFDAVFSLIPLLTGLGMAEYQQRLARLAELLQSGELTFPSPRREPLEAMARVHSEYESGQLRDKIVFTPSVS